MAGELSLLDNLKKVYKPDLDDNRPVFAVLQERLSAEGKGILEVGEKIVLPVILTHQGGESYGAANNVDTLNTPIPMVMDQAETDQYEITEIVRMPFGLVSKVGQSKAARFADKARILTLAGQTAAKLKLETVLLHGGRGVARVTTSAGSVSGSGPWTRTINIDPATWSDGFWTYQEGQAFDCFTALTGGTQRNDAGLLSVTSVDFAAKTVTFSTAGASNDLSDIVANDILFKDGSRGNQAYGLMYFAQEADTSGATVLGVSTNYSAWRTKPVTVSGPITWGKLLSGCASSMAGGLDGRITVLANSKNMADLHKDFMSSRRLDASYSTGKLKNGARAIEYVFGSRTFELVGHDLMWDGDVVAYSEANWFRAGSDPDPVMSLGGEELKLISSTSNSFEFRWFSAGALIPNGLANMTYFSGITPSAT